MSKSDQLLKEFREKFTKKETLAGVGGAVSVTVCNYDKYTPGDVEFEEQVYLEDIETWLKSAFEELLEGREPTELTTTLVVIPEGYTAVKVKSIGNIIAKPIKNIPDGASYKTVVIDEVISLSQKKELE